MINQQSLFQLYRQMTGSTVYEYSGIPGTQERWQRARIEEYAFQCIEVK